MEGVTRRGAMLERDRSSMVDEREVTFTRFVTDRLAAQYRLATVILGADAEAQDATHDAFELAWRRWDSLRDPARLDAWFGRILVNVCRERLRSRRRSLVRDVSRDVADSIATSDESGRHADRDEIGRALEVLNVDQRLVVILRFYADLTVDQIAERVGVPPGTVKSRLHHAMAALNAELSTAAGGRGSG